MSFQEASAGVEPAMADLQSAALATWLRRLKFWDLGRITHHSESLYATRYLIKILRSSGLGKLET